MKKLLVLIGPLLLCVGGCVERTSGPPVEEPMAHSAMRSSPPRQEPALADSTASPAKREPTPSLPKSTADKQTTEPARSCLGIDDPPGDANTPRLTVEGTLKVSKERHPTRNTEFEVCTLALDRPRCFQDARQMPEGIEREDLSQVSTVGVWEKCTAAQNGKRVRVVGAAFVATQNAYNPFQVGIRAERIDELQK